MKIVGLEESVAQSTAGMMINVNCVFLISGNTFETLNMEKDWKEMGKLHLAILNILVVVNENGIAPSDSDNGALPLVIRQIIFLPLVR